MSEVRVNKLSPRSGTTVTLGDSGDTISIPSGVTFDASSGGLAGTLTTAAQPNITSVGTLTGFTSTGIDDNATSTAMTISSGEIVSIGTTSASGGWQVKVAGSNAPLELARTTGDTIERSHLGMEREGTFVGQFKSDATNLWLEASAGALIINTGGGSERMRIDSSGNVGIGTSSPQEHLSINVALNDTEGLGLQYSNDTKGGIKLNPIGGEVRMGAFNSTGTYFTTFYSNNVEAMRIDSFGRFVINGDTPDTGAIQTTIHDGNTTYGLTLATVNTSGTQYHQRFLRGGGGGTSAGYITSNSATTIAFNNASDERLKENIENSGSAIQDLKDIQVRQFDWIDNIDTHRDFGFVAQELVNVVPEAVTQGTDELDENGKPVISWGVDYSHIVPRLVKVCQEQQTKIEDLEARILALETTP